MRNYHSQVFFGDAPTRELRNNPAILVGETNFNKIDSIVGEAFYRFDYIRIWWPNQDYFNLTWDRILFALSDPLMREALFQIWLNRDFTRYGEATGRDFSLQYWRPANLMRLYIRKDIVAQLWDFGTTPAADVFFADPYEGKQITLDADQVIGSPGTEPGLFQNPRDMVIAPDGSLYIADTGNHRIQHLAPDGTVLHVWGRFANLTAGEAPGGTFNEPWGIAVSPDGTVYVADTWNHRIQRFTPEGEFLNMWGFFGQAETPF